MQNPFPIVDTTDWPVVEFESAGSEEKFWLTEPGTERRWLFKPITVRDDRRQGENWSERLASALAALLEVPAARVELAERGRRVGSISLNVVPEHWEMQPGAVVLSEVCEDYDSSDRDRRGHNLGNICAALKGCGPPRDAQVPNNFTAFDVFAGYLVLDAWIANRDRHDENWGLLRGPSRSDPRRLAPSYDHASSLGFNLLDAKREHLLTHDGLLTFAQRGTAWRFEGGRRMPLVELARRAFGFAAMDVREHWLDRLSAVTPEDCRAIIAQVPGLSVATGKFTEALLTTNRRRLLDEC